MTSLQATAESVPSTETPSDAPEPRIMEHAYDGIREYDNPLPGWWKAIFWGTIVFSAFYGLYYHVFRIGTSKEESYLAGLSDYDSKKERRAAAEAASMTEESLAAAVADSKVVATGAAIFAAKCASCHEKQGQGVIGPNLTDGFQLHGQTRMDILTTIRGGIPGTAMIAWGEQLGGPDLVAAAAFVVTLRHTNVKGKEPQGHQVEPFKR